MYYACKPSKIAIYLNNARKTAYAIQREIGCDVLINGGLFDGTFRPCCWLKVDGKILHTEAWHRPGYGWDNNVLVYDGSENIAKYRNYIQCVELPNNLNKKPSYPAEIGGRRGRSAIGVRKDGSVVVWCTSDGAYALTPEQLQVEMKNLGCVTALMLDGGGSSQCIFPNGSIASQRIVQNYIAIWTEKPPEQSNPQCPFTEPTRNIRWGSLGEGAKWVQWQLRRHGILIDVDGLFFNQSVSALRSFQVAHRLTNDGICGSLTREALKL